MLQYNEILQLLDQWEYFKTTSCPVGDSVAEVIEHALAKTLVDKHARELRPRMFSGRPDPTYVDNFVNSYTKFGQQFVFRVLKNS